MATRQTTLTLVGHGQSPGGSLRELEQGHRTVGDTDTVVSTAASINDNVIHGSILTYAADKPFQKYRLSCQNVHVRWRTHQAPRMRRQSLRRRHKHVRRRLEGERLQQPALRRTTKGVGRERRRARHPLSRAGRWFLG